MKKDKYHQEVREALEKDGWRITHDPYYLRVGRRKGYIDLGAERAIIAAEKGDQKIAVEIKSFLGASDLDEFEDAVGQFIVYLLALEEKEPQRELFLAMPKSFYLRFFDDPFFVKLAKRYNLRLLVFDEKSKTVVQWIE